MSGEDYASAVLNPFSTKAKELLDDAPPFDSLPQNVINRAVERIEETSGSEAIVELKEDAIREEVLSFYLMCQSVAAVSYPYSEETRTIADATRDAIQYRMHDFFSKGHEDFCIDVIKEKFRLRKLEDGEETKLDEETIPRKDLLALRDMALREDGIDVEKEEVDYRILSKYMPRYAVRWTDLDSLMMHRRVDLTSQYIVKGWALITPKQLWRFYSDNVAAELEEYVSSLYDRFSGGGRPPSSLLEEVGEKISEAVPEQVRKTKRTQISRGKLRPDSFPPCVRKVLKGVGSGNRNYGIIVLLTSFLSYARISPSGKATPRVADFIDDISVVEEEIFPLISGAAKKCNPPLFEDQPQDKPNVYYHMGFGMNTQPRLRDSGKSKWYSPPNCRKLKTEAPTLCNPDDLCSEIKNPLTYYYKDLSQKSKSGGD